MAEVYRLFLLQPVTVFAAQIAQSVFTYPISQVTFDNVTAGAFGSVRVGQTVYFGSSPGGFDLGAQRIRALPTSTTLYFGRSSQGTRQGEVDLADNVYITVTQLREVWGRPPFIGPNGEIEKDPGLAVEWRTTTPPPVANTGPGFCRTIDPITGLITVALPPTANTSFATADGATITTYLWDVKDGAIVSGTSASSTIVATFPAGFRYVELTVTDSEGHSHTAYCPIFARDPDADPTIEFEFQQHSISADGQRIAVRPLINIPAGTYAPGTLAMIWRNEPADMFDRSHMIVIGWLGDIPATIQAQPKATLRDVTLNLLDVAARLDTLPGFSQHIEDDFLRDATDFPAITWMHYVNLTMDKYLHYLLAWHSTALGLADFEWSGTGETYAATGLHSDGQSLWKQLVAQASKMRPDYALTCNRRGQLRVVPNPMLRDLADRTSDTQGPAGGLTADDWSDLRYDHRRHPRAHWLRGGAVRSGRTLPISTVFSVAPGDAPGQGEVEQTLTEGLVASQAVHNATEGHRYARVNAAQSEFRITLAAGDDLNIEPADMTWVELTLPAALAAQRGLSFTASRGLPKELNIRYSHAKTGLTKTVDMVWERETVGKPAVTYIPPQGDLPGDDTTWPGDYWDVPPGDVVTPPEVPPLPLYLGQEKVALISDVGSIFRTSNFTSGGASPTWDVKTLTGISGSNKILSFVVDPFSPLYRGTGTTVNAFVATENSIRKIGDIFGATPTLTTLLTFASATNPSLDRRRTIQASFGRFFATETDNPWLVCVSHYGNLSGKNGTWATYSVDGGVTWSSEVQLTEFKDHQATPFETPPIGLYLSPKTPGLAYTVAYTANGASGTPAPSIGYVSTNWGATWAQISNPAIDPLNRLGGDIHTPWPTNDNERVVYHGSTDKGATRNYALLRVEADGSTVTDISPSDATRQYGVDRQGFAVRTFDNDRRYVALAGIGNGVTGAAADDYFAVFVSNNFGDNWTAVVAAIAKASAHPEHVAMGADTHETLYLWGLNFIKYSGDFGATIEDKFGNLGDFTGVKDFIGLCGGDAPP